MFDSDTLINWLIIIILGGLAFTLAIVFTFVIVIMLGCILDPICIDEMRL